MEQREPLSADTIDLKTVRMVQAIEEAGSITGAAELLGLSQPAISQHLRRAEARLGMPLVHRAGRTVQLAEAGLVISSIAPGVQQGLTFALERLSEIRGLRTGSIRFAGFASASESVVPSLLARLRAEHPDAALSYLELQPSNALERLFIGDCDLALVYRFPTSRFDAPWFDPTKLIAQPLFREELLLALPESHPAGTSTTVDLREFAQSDWVGPVGIEGWSPRVGHGDQNPPPHDELTCLEDVTAAAGFDPRIRIRTDNISASLRMVARGLGVTLIPQLSVESGSIPAGVAVRRLTTTPWRAVEAVSLKLHSELPLVKAAAASLRRLTAPRRAGDVLDRSPRSPLDETRT